MCRFPDERINVKLLLGGMRDWREGVWDSDLGFSCSKDCARGVVVRVQQKEDLCEDLRRECVDAGILEIMMAKGGEFL